MVSFWDWLSDTLHTLLVGISRALGPVVGWVDGIDFAVERQMDGFGVPLAWQGWIIAAIWSVLLLGLVAVLRGWWRLLAILVIAVVMLRYFQVLPGV